MTSHLEVKVSDDGMASHWWFVIAAIVLVYSWSVPDGLEVLQFLSWILAAGLVVMGLIKLKRRLRSN